MPSGQIAMEYFVSYSWAFILVATFFGLLTFVYSTPTEGISCSSSDPVRFEVRSINVPGPESPNNHIVFLNSSGEKISVTGMAFSGYIEDLGIANLNGVPLSRLSPTAPAELGPSGTASLANFTVSLEKPEQGKITISYENAAGAAGGAEIFCSGTVLR